jgi:transcriptional regulator of acetoin/glycerol metabolism
LDEIGDLPASSQAALLRVLQEGEVLPVGATQPVTVDVRIIAATHMPLEELVEKGLFRRDLYARLAGYTFTLPPLRDRRVDLGVIAASLFASGKLGSREVRIHREALRAMLSYDWPMNVRELEQSLRASMILAEDDVISAEDLPAPVIRALLEAPSEEDGPPEQEDELRRELLTAT